MPRKRAVADGMAAIAPTASGGVPALVSQAPPAAAQDAALQVAGMATISRVARAPEAFAALAPQSGLLEQFGGGNSSVIEAAAPRHHGGATPAGDFATSLLPAANIASFSAALTAAQPAGPDAHWLSAGLRDGRADVIEQAILPFVLATSAPAAPQVTFSSADVATTQPQKIDFTSGAQGAFGSDTSFFFSLPSFLWQHQHIGAGTTAGGFGIYVGASITGGIKGSVALSLGQYTPDYPVTIDPNTLPFVQDGSLFTLDPTLISSDDAAFSLSLPQANASLDFGLDASVGATLSFPPLHAGFNVPFVGFVGTTINLPSVKVGANVSGLFKLPSNSTIQIPGGSVTISELAATTLSTGGTSLLGGLPTLEISGDTKPFIVANVDLAALLEQEEPDPFKLLHESTTYANVLTVGYNLLQLPLSGTLWLNEQTTLTPIGITETATDMLTGQSETGTLGQSFTFTAPATGNGVIPVSITYSLTLAVETVLYLDGAVKFTIEGPEVYGSVNVPVFGRLFSQTIGPFGNFNLLDESGQLFELYSNSFTQVLTTTEVVDIQNFGTSVTQTISGHSSGVKVTKPATDVFVAATGTVTGSTFGVETGTLSTAMVTNAGLITATGNGVYLQEGGTVDVVAGGRILAAGTAPGDGILLVANVNDAVSNAGIISGFSDGANLLAGSLQNEKGGTISATGVGVLIGAAGASVTNDGLVQGATGVWLQNGGTIYNALAGTITGSTYGVYAGGALSLENQCTLTGTTQGIRALAGGTVTNLAGAYIHGGVLGVLVEGGNANLINQSGAVISGGKFGVSLGGSNTVLTNDGTISGSVDGVQLYGSVSNTLNLDPTGKIIGGVRMQYGASDTINLLAESGVTGTLAGLGTVASLEGAINISTGATWDISGNFTDIAVNGFALGDVLNDTAIAFKAGERVVVAGGYGEPTYLSVREAGHASVVIGTIQGDFGLFPSVQVTRASAGGIDIAASTAVVGTVTANNGQVTIYPGGRFASTLTIAAGVTVSSHYYGAGITQQLGVFSGNERATLTNLGTIIGTSIGVEISGGGTVTNGSLGVISGAVGVSMSDNSITSVDPFGLTNAGSITAQNGAVYLFADGTVSNLAGGVIRSSGFSGVTLEGAHSVLNNAGTIAGGRDAANLVAGGFVYNAVTGTLSGTGGGARFTGGYGEVINQGSIGSTNGAGIYLGDGGRVINDSGTISGGAGGVQIVGAAGDVDNGAIIDGIVLSNGGTISNAGTINASAGNASAGNASAGGTYGVSLAPVAGAMAVAAYVQNAGFIAGVQAYGGDLIVNTGTIQGAIDGIDAVGAAIVTNAVGGVIIGLGGSGIGVDLQAGGTLTNAGSISGTGFGVELGGVATLLIDSGSISGAQAVALIGTSSNTLVLDPGAVLTGDVTAKFGASNSITLAAGSFVGTLNGFGTTVLDFNAVTIASGAAWVIEATSAQATATAFTGANATDTLALTGGGGLRKSFSGFGTLALGGSAGFTLSAAQMPKVGDIVLATGATLGGTGTLGAMLSGAGTLSAAAAQTVTLAGGFDFAGALAGPGTVVLASNGTLSAGAVITATTEQHGNLVLGSGENLSLGKLDYSITTTAAAQTLQITGAKGDKISNAGTLASAGAGTVKIAPALKNTGLIEAQAGTLSLLGALTNSGTILAADGTVIVAHQAQGSGTLDVGAASALWLKDGATAGQAAHFLASTGTLELSSPAAFLGSIAGFAGADVIDLAGTAANTASFANGTLTVSEGSSVVAQLRLSGTYTSTSFTLAGDGHGGTAIAFHG